MSVKVENFSLLAFFVSVFWNAVVRLLYQPNYTYVCYRLLHMNDNNMEKLGKIKKRLLTWQNDHSGEIFILLAAC